MRRQRENANRRGGVHRRASSRSASGSYPRNMYLCILFSKAPIKRILFATPARRKLKRGRKIYAGERRPWREIGAGLFPPGELRYNGWLP